MKMKIAMSSRWLLLVLTDVLLMSLVGGYSNIFMEANAETSVTTTDNYIPERSNFKREYDAAKAPVCGHTGAITTNVRRELDSYEDTLVDDIHHVSHLDKILGGKYVTYGAIPWMVAIIFQNQLMCGGAVISEFWVISAAHCFYKLDKAAFRIVVGDHRRYYRDAYEDAFSVDTIIIHESYRAEEINFDIALVKIKARMNGRGIRFNSYVQPICLAFSTEDPAVGTPLTFSGWGRTSADARPFVFPELPAYLSIGVPHTRFR